MLKGGSYSDIWKAIIRPPRDEYKISELGKILLLPNTNFKLQRPILIANKW